MDGTSIKDCSNYRNAVEKLKGSLVPTSFQLVLSDIEKVPDNMLAITTLVPAISHQSRTWN